MWNKVPVIIGGQSCESCGDAFLRFGPPRVISREEFRNGLIAEGFTGVNESAVGPDTLENWYSDRISTEGRWRTFARILSDSGHACSSTLHANALGSTSTNVWRYFFNYTQRGD